MRVPLALLIALLALGCYAPALASAEEEYDPNVTAKFTGTYSVSTSNYIGAEDTSSATVEWEETVTGPLDDIAFGLVSGATTHGAVSVSYSAKGTLTATLKPPNQKSSCTGKVSAVPGSIVALSAPFAGEASIGVNGISPVTYGNIQTDKTEGFCAMGPKYGASYVISPPETVMSDPKYQPWFEPVLATQAGLGPVSQEYSFSDSGKSGNGTGTASGTATLSFFGAPAVPGVTPTTPAKPTTPTPPPAKPEPPPTSQKAKEAAEKRKQEIKEQARADLKPALEEAWAAHGLSGVLGIAGGMGLDAVATDIGGPATAVDSNDASTRVVNDYRIYNDPPAPEFGVLANPVIAKPKALPSCRRFRRASAAFCRKLRGAETALLTQSSTVAGIDGALEVTIDRDSAAIVAGAYAAAESQASHFAALRAQMQAALAVQGGDGAKVAKLLKQAGVNGRLTKAQSAGAIKWLEGRLAKSAITPAQPNSARWLPRRSRRERRMRCPD